MTRQYVLGLVAALFAAVTWGVQLPLAKDAFAILDPFYITTVRYLAAAALLAVLLVLREGWVALSYRGHAMAAVALGVVGICGSPTLVFLGMSLSRAEHAVVIVSLQPMIAALAIWALRGRRPTAMTTLCTLAAFAGVVLVVTKGSLAVIGSSRQLLGDVIVFLGAACWVVYTLGIGRLSGWSVWRITVLTRIPGALATAAIAATLMLAGALACRSQRPSWQWRGVGLPHPGRRARRNAGLEFRHATHRATQRHAVHQLHAGGDFRLPRGPGLCFAAIEIVGALLVVAALVTNNLWLRHAGACRGGSWSAPALNCRVRRAAWPRSRRFRRARAASNSVRGVSSGSRRRRSGGTRANADGTPSVPPRRHRPGTG